MVVEQQEGTPWFMDKLIHVSKTGHWFDSENRRMAAKNLAGQKRKAIIDWQNHEVHDN